MNARGRFDTPELKLLLESYYHENFRDEAPEFGSLYGALHTYIDESETGDLLRILNEIAYVCDAFDDDRELGLHLQTMGSYVYLGNSDLSYRQWLGEMARRIRASLPSSDS